LGLFTVPALLIHLASGWISAFTRTALFTLVPVFAVVLDPYLGNETSRPVLSRLPVALAAVLGAVLVFPISIPTSVEATASFAAVILAAILVAAANACAVALFQPAATQSLAPIAATGALSLGILSAALENNAWHWTAIAPELLWTAVLQLPSLWLLFWLMRRLSAVHLALRFVLAPALAVPLGALLMQLPLALRTCLGLLGMAGGAVYLLLMPESEAESASLLRSADSHPDSQ
jgi:drug/metabolite transporter (DMT)-like permease